MSDKDTSSAHVKPTVTISLDLYNELLIDRRVLRALEAAGVDNWDWYGDAMATLDPDGEADST